MNYWFDIDGVIAIYERNAYTGEDPLYLRPNAHYFMSLEKDMRMVNAIRLLYKKKDNTDEIFALSSVPPLSNLFAEHVSDKKLWTHIAIPEMNIETNFVPAVSEKRMVVAMLTGKNRMMLTDDETLVDDYNPNLDAWREHNGTAIKYLNGINSPDSWDGLKITQNMTSEEICDMLLALKNKKIG